MGAADPERAAIEKLLTDAGVRWSLATVDGRPVHPGNAYRAVCPAGVTHAVECCDVLPPGVVRIDHHRPGDPGYGRPPEGFLAASSIGQVVAELARLAGTHWGKRIVAAEKRG